MAFRIILILLLGFLSDRLQAAPAPDIEEQTRAVSAELRCVVCQNLSVADSPSEMAQQMRASVREQLQAGKSPQEIKDFFVSKYGEWVLLAPTNTGFNRLLWWLPLTVLIIGVIAALLLARRWTARKAHRVAPAMDPSIADRLRKEALAANVQAPDVDDSTARAQVVRESLRLADELTELEFDFESGKLSKADYSALRSTGSTTAKLTATGARGQSTGKDCIDWPARAPRPPSLPALATGHRRSLPSSFRSGARRFVDSVPASTHLGAGLDDRRLPHRHHARQYRDSFRFRRG